jgi:hypothetical protein
MSLRWLQMHDVNMYSTFTTYTVLSIIDCSRQDISILLLQFYAKKQFDNYHESLKL